MNGLLVRTDGGNQSVTFNLSAFVTDWEAARKTFVPTIAERFREPLYPRPGDFSAASPPPPHGTGRGLVQIPDIRRIELHRP